MKKSAVSGVAGRKRPIAPLSGQRYPLRWSRGMVSNECREVVVPWYSKRMCVCMCG